MRRKTAEPPVDTIEEIFSLLDDFRHVLEELREVAHDMKESKDHGNR